MPELKRQLPRVNLGQTVPIRPGGDVISPRVLTRAAPSIPDLAIKLRAAGEVSLSFVVQTDRTIRDIQVVRSIGYGMDEEAIQTVKKWRFAPGTKDGLPVDVRIRAAVGFSEALDAHAWGAFAASRRGSALARFLFFRPDISRPEGRPAGSSSSERRFVSDSLPSSMSLKRSFGVGNLTASPLPHQRTCGSTSGGSAG